MTLNEGALVYCLRCKTNGIITAGPCAYTDHQSGHHGFVYLHRPIGRSRDGAWCDGDLLVESPIKPVGNEATRMVERERLVREVLNRGLVRECPTCGPSVVHAYATATLRCAVNGSVILDDNPTHLCVPPPPQDVARKRESLHDSLVSEVVDTWA